MNWRYLVALAAILAVVGCAGPKETMLMVQHPAKLNINPKIQRVFINPDFIQAGRDQLGLKQELLQRLKQDIEKEGRYRVTLGPVGGFDPNRETVALVQGQIVSREEVRSGYTNQVVPCYPMTRPLPGATRSKRGLICHDKASPLLSSIGYSLAGRSVPPKDMAIQAVPYQNVTHYLQMDLSFTEIGKTRETLAIRSEKASFSERVSYDPIHVYDNGMHPSIAHQYVDNYRNPMLQKQWALATGTKPGNVRLPRFPMHPLTRSQAEKIDQELVEQVVSSFLSVISPYRAQNRIPLLASGSKLKKMALRGDWQGIRNKLQGQERIYHDENFYLGLSYEATAAHLGDYQQAKEHYLKALEEKPDESVYGRALGRVAKRIKDYKKLRRQGGQDE